MLVSVPIVPVTVGTMRPLLVSIRNCDAVGNGAWVGVDFDVVVELGTVEVEVALVVVVVKAGVEVDDDKLVSTNATRAGCLYTAATVVLVSVLTIKLLLFISTFPICHTTVRVGFPGVLEPPMKGMLIRSSCKMSDVS